MSAPDPTDRLRRVAADALRRVGARDFDTLLVPALEAVRVEFVGPHGRPGVLVVHADRGFAVGYRASLLPSSLGVRLDDLGDVLRAERAGVDPGSTATNNELRALRDARVETGSEEISRVYALLPRDSFASREAASLLRVGDLDLNPYSVVVRAVTRLLTDLASGAPVEWVLRRFAPGGDS